ncbi:hypothetical protein LTR36_007167 [Oleoguttula mirabilis]|uniref:PSP1 C-terminal domain-containing protein n=1 Tax=Oleoguttula mirabilis TaxID=1507867 RepID=A0AAV9JA32_9PEZI|nr:hypothetical protein LTR36_007167 [Oleoguttula mirabilis]
MNTVRRATPDSEAVGSSEDERPWPSSTSFGSLPRKEQGMPGLPGGIWSTQRKGSFKLSEAAHRNAVREVRLGAGNAHSSLRTANTPSPTMSEGTGALPFAIPLQPTPKVHRSLSHSQGQREPPQSSATLAAGSLGASALPLGLLAEENDSESDDGLGGRLTQTVSHPPIGSLQRAATYSAAYDHYGVNYGSGHPDEQGIGQAGPRLGRGLDAAFANLGYGIQNRGTMRFNDDPHGFEIPAIYKVPYVQIAPEELTEDDMRRERHRQASLSHPNPWATAAARGGDGPRPRKLLFIVSFKCSRVEVFFLLDNTGLDIHEGDIVIVEADRGQDLGTVQHANVTPDQARLYKRKYAEEQYKWLMMFSRNNEPSNVNPNAQLYGESSAMGTSRGNGNGSDNGNGNSNLLANAPSTMMGLPRDNFNTLKPKAIKRLANSHEIKMLGEKEGNEAKAKRTCQQKVAHLHLQMEILDAEWQWDFQKLIFYYYADHYINFKDLITDLYRIYKTRIWLSAVNPASFSQHAMGQSPSAIAPGAITGGHGGNDLSYSMAYGADPDPYGAVRPYRIGYETYTPNYPGIPGVANSFAPPGGSVGGGGGGLHQLAVASSAGSFQPVTDSNNALPSVQPGASQTGAAADYHFYYDRSGNNEHMMPFTPAETPVPASATTHNPASAIPFNPYANPYFNPNLMFGAPALNTAFMTPVSPWNTNTPIHPNAAGLGRQRELPQPIGTRPASNGSAEARLRNLTLSNRYESHASSSQHFTNNGNGNAGSS